MDRGWVPSAVAPVGQRSPDRSSGTLRLRAAPRRGQGQADRALADGRVAAERLRSVQGALSLAETDFTGASAAARTARAETQKPDPDQVKQAVADADAAQQRLSAAQGQVNGAQQ